jgi:hypothetical protein
MTELCERFNLLYLPIKGYEPYLHLIENYPIRIWQYSPPLILISQLYVELRNK